jgi:hypothetical protein
VEVDSLSAALDIAERTVLLKLARRRRAAGLISGAHAFTSGMGFKASAVGTLIGSGQAARAAGQRSIRAKAAGICVRDGVRLRRVSDLGDGRAMTPQLAARYALALGTPGFDGARKAGSPST